MLRQVLFVLLVLACAPALAGKADGARYYNRAEEGWFWYDDPELSAPPPEVRALVVPGGEGGAGEPAPLSTAWLRANIDKYRDRAIDEPTVDNVSLFLYLQRLTMDHAQQFAEAAQLATQLDPALDESNRRPTANFAAQVASETADAARVNVLKKISSSAGIWFFYRSDCPYCIAEAPALQLFEQLYDFTVTGISLDGLGLPTGAYPNYVVDQGQAARLGVVGTPAMFLVRPPEKILPISQGSLAVDQLAERIITIAHASGWISEEEWTSTRVYKPTYLTDQVKASPDVINDPKRLLALMRQAGIAAHGMTPLAGASRTEKTP